MVDSRPARAEAVKVSMRELLVMVVISALTCLGVDSMIQGSYRIRAAHHAAVEDQCLHLYMRAARLGHKKQADYMLGRAAYHYKERRRYEKALHRLW
jgi:hypothetical protein